MLITASSLKSALSNQSNYNDVKFNEICDFINTNGSKYCFYTKSQVNALLANLLHESGEFTRVTESFKYKPERLCTIFKSKFLTHKNPLQHAQLICKQGEQAVADFLYSNRKDLGNCTPNDGWKYKGRGYIQLTGRSNYQAITDDTGIDFINNPDLITSTYSYCILSSLWFWKRNRLYITFDKYGFSGVCDTINFGRVKKSINGNQIVGLSLGYADRKKYFDKLENVNK